MCPKVLAQVRAATRLEVQQLGSCVGVTHLILRNGRCVFSHSDGWANKKLGTKFRPNTICRLHGATKAIVCAALMTLVEQGKVKLDDPITKHMPFSERVAAGRAGASRPARAPATVRHLLTMTAGLRYTDCPAYKSVIAGVRKGRISDLAGFCEALAGIPLQSEPGAVYDYSFCTDFVGRLCEVVSGMSLEAFVKKSILKPLGMKDTHFVLPTHKRGRVAALYKLEEVRPPAKRRRGAAAAPAQRFRAVEWDHPDSAPGITSSGGGVLSYKDPGLWGTARDYARFCQLLIDGGLAPGSGRRILKASTARACWTDGLAVLSDGTGRLASWNVDDTEGPPWEGASWDRCGWSPLSTLLQLKGPLRPGGPAAKGRLGHTMGVGGGGGVYWLADAGRRVVALSFQQCFDGGRAEDDGLGPPGNDCVDLAVKAVDEGKRGRKRPRE